MRHLLSTSLPAVLALAGLLGPVKACHAQAIWGGELDRAFGPGASAPYDGASFSHRYHYSTGPVLFLNQDARRLYYLDYLDRLDRAERFGYCPPRPPKWLAPPLCPPPVRGGWTIHGGVLIR